MKVLIITNYLGNRGGLGRYSREVAMEMRKQNITVKVLSEAKKPSEDFEHAVLKPVFKQTKIRQIIHIISNSLQVRRASRNFNIIHAHDGWPYAIYGYLAVLGTKKKLFVTGIGSYTIAPLHESGLKKWFLTKSLLRAVKVMCISDYICDLLNQALPHVNSNVVFMGTTKLSRLSTLEMNNYKKEHTVNDQYPIILSVGDIKNRKGQLDTLKALHLIKKDHPNFLYVLIGEDGDTPYRNAILDFAEKNDLQNNIRIISHMYDDKVLSFYYEICTLFALNSNNSKGHFEGFGLVFLEAAQFGKLSVGSSGCGIESAIKDNYTGYLSKQGDHEDIARQIKKIIEKKGNAHPSNAKKFYTGFSWKKTVENYLKEYRD